MSCWRRTTILRIPAIYLGFEYWEQWKAFLRRHEDDLDWSQGFFSNALCENYLYEDYYRWIRNNEDAKSSKRLDLGLFPQHIKTVPGPFLDYYLDEICPSIGNCFRILPWNRWRRCITAAMNGTTAVKRPIIIKTERKAETSAA